MLMPRLQYHLNGYNPEMSITLSMQHQQQHINQLLNTAATATGIVGDVDALLTPIQNSNTMPVRAEHSRERNLWRTNEIMEMLIIMQEIKALEMLSVKTIKSDMVFRKVERIMHLRGFRKKSHVQIWTKWKFLKSTYTTSRRNGIIPKMIPQPIYEELHKMLQNVNSNCSGRSTSDCGNSATSLDGDDSNGATANNCSNDNENKLVISGVEGGYGVGSKKSLNGCVAGPESDEENGLAHPIFGFRLGLVKQEPADTGYECSNIKEKDTTDNIQFQTEVKQEVTEPDDPPSASTSPSRHVSGDEQLQQQPLRQSLPEIMILTPTTNTTTTISTPKATSTPKSNISVSQTQPGAENPTLSTPPPLPPLRIARFAKIPPSEITTADSNINLPPPPLTMNPTSQTLRLRHYNSGTYTVNGKGNSNTNILTYTRKFATINPQAVTITTPGHQTTVHPYIRPQEVVVPDLHVTAAPHEHRAPQPFYGFPDGPSTSQQAQQQQVQEIEARKRRLKASLLNAMPPKRMPRAPETLTKPTSRQAKSEFNSEINDDGLNDSPNEDDYIHQEPPQQGGAQASPENTERNSSYPKVLQDMAISLRQMQREAINEFFKHQMKLAREEHEFQMRQDALLMQAFKEQAQQFQLMSKELMGSSVKLEKRKKRLEKQAQKQFTNNKKMHTRQMQDRTGGNAKVLLNGVNKPKVEHKEVLEESKKEVKVLMRNIHAQLELTEDEVDDDEQNQYEYDVSAYLQDNSTGSLMQKSALTPEPPGDIECSEENNITSDPVQILG
ncbi:uncharacterized protein LOC105214033 [Zeugodacus cucurbitae]|uniref:uncharacterized protein LOC105214033 n=1 Tax=Zeugodacus cucurbitae TaxID=28588 RepID=UPI0023D94A62|nr:uncharacterized protein LOC105214033 [Zeugodacus cucurbitae]XP_028897405.2 uncharacterized protein LOC105214033 [Zeugodacus cucurbitae]XP_054082219.1 uncharacterized protein LOC105214033 [Zeugodacus cucurbitae]XP_054082221.1 uncharacterized protein LOC105214033 [Zeugodacus cucurbitae]